MFSSFVDHPDSVKESQVKYPISLVSRDFENRVIRKKTIKCIILSIKCKKCARYYYMTVFLWVVL